MVAIGEMSLAEAKNQLSGSDYAKAGDKLKKAHELYLERSADALHKQMIENNKMVSVHWFYGESETGKSYLAEQLAKETGLSYYKTTTSTDPFQCYQAEAIIILDELRPEMIPYSELLALLNPFSRGKVGVNIKAMQDILGHADAETTMQIYAEATKDLKKSELINFDEYFAKQKKAQSGN